MTIELDYMRCDPCCHKQTKSGTDVLSQVASNLGVADEDFREAECQDEAAIRGLFSKLIACSRCKSQCASLQGEDAQKLLDLIHNVSLNYLSPKSPN